ncbi:MAG: glycosyltransferase family 1 protein [Pseudomonadota bacterium]
MAAPTHIVMDISRLRSRTKRGTPTGIDRVELEEVEKALSLGDNAFFFATQGKRSWFIPRQDVAALAKALGRRWAAGSEDGLESAARLYAFLGIEAPLPRVSDAPSLPKISGPRAVGAQFFARRMERKLQAERADIVYRNVSHHHLDKDGFLIGLKQRWRARIEVYWHDAIPILWPEYAREGDSDKHRRRLHAVLRYADRIRVNSRVTEAELAHLAQMMQLPLPELTVDPLRPPRAFCGKLEAALAARPYFLCVGTIEPRKNHRMLLEVWRELAAELGPDTPALVLAGRRGWMNADTFALLDRCPALQEHVIEAPELPDAVLACIMKGARALVMPSFAEGFGLPVVEAQAVGTPVIASDLPAFREVALRPFTALPPLAGDRWKQAVIQHLQSNLGQPAKLRHGAS